jgi:hypothetical protein
MISWAGSLPGHPGNRGAPPDEVIWLLVAGGVLLGAFIVFVIVWAVTGPARSRKKVARILATGTRAPARVILLGDRPTATGWYDLTVEVATTPSFVAKLIAVIPSEALPTVLVGSSVQVCWDPADAASVVLVHPTIVTFLP